MSKQTTTTKAKTIETGIVSNFKGKKKKKKKLFLELLGQYIFHLFLPLHYCCILIDTFMEQLSKYI